MARKRIVIIGGVATGPKAAARCRRLDQEAEITMVERGDLLSYAGCGMPFYIEGIVEFETLLKTSVGVIRDADYFESGMGIRVMVRTEAVKINRVSKTVTVKDLETDETTDLPYDKLVLATGARPFVPRMEGVGCTGSTTPIRRRPSVMPWTWGPRRSLSWGVGSSGWRSAGPSWRGAARSPSWR